MEVITHGAVDAFVNALGAAEYGKTIRAIELLREYGGLLSPPHSKKIDSNLFELRVRGDQQVRLLYGFWNSKAVIVHGFVKKTPKTPLRDIKLARERLSRLA